MLKSTLLALTVTLAVPALAWGQSQPPPPSVVGAQPAPSSYPPLNPPPVPPHPRRVFSLTISPVHLTLPVLELTGEFRASDKVGLAVVAGAGKYSETTDGIKLSASVYEAGAQFRYYVLGDFRHGMQLGAELLYLHLSDSNLSLKGEGLAIGPFAGYKITTDIGFTFDAQLGFERISARATAPSSAEGNSDYILLLNLNVGWSF